MNIDNTIMPTSFINPINTFVTGEVIVERNETNSSKALLLFRYSESCFIFLKI